MRRLLLICLILLLPGRAEADVTAHYRADSGVGMVVFLADNGDRLIEHGAHTAYLTIGGETYLILNDARGSYTTRRETFLAALRALPRAEPQPTEEERYSIVDRGDEVVAGFPGSRISIGTEGSRQDRMELVISTAPELQQVGRAVAGHIVPWLSVVPGPEAEIAETLRTVLQRGALVRLGNLLVLDRIDRSPIPAERLRLPSPPLDQQALTSRMLETMGR